MAAVQQTMPSTEIRTDHSGEKDAGGAASIGSDSVAHAETGDADFDAAAEKKLVRKIDLMLIPWLSFLYLLSFLDRTSIGNVSAFL